MINEKTYKKEIVRMWDSIRDDEYKGEYSCKGVPCWNCPLLGRKCERIFSIEIIEAVEKWSKEHPKQKYKVSQFEFDFLEENLKCVDGAYYLKFSEIRQLEGLLKKGYFKGATREMKVKDYFDNCKVE